MNKVLLIFGRQLNQLIMAEAAVDEIMKSLGKLMDRATRDALLLAAPSSERSYVPVTVFTIIRGILE